MSLLVKAFLLNISAPLQTSSLSTVRLQSSVLTFAIGLSTTLSVDAKKQFLICACFRYTCEHDFFLELTHDLQLVEGLPHSAALWTAISTWYSGNLERLQTVDPPLFFCLCYISEKNNLSLLGCLYLGCLFFGYLFLGCSSPGLLVPRAARPPGCSFLGCLIAVTAASSTTFPWACIEVFFNTLNGKFSFAVNALCWLGHYTEMHKLVFFKPWQPEHHCVKAALKKAQVEI